MRCWMFTVEWVRQNWLTVCDIASEVTKWDKLGNNMRWTSDRWLRQHRNDEVIWDSEAPRERIQFQKNVQLILIHDYWEKIIKSAWQLVTVLPLSVEDFFVCRPGEWDSCDLFARDHAVAFRARDILSKAQPAGSKEVLDFWFPESTFTCK